MQKQGFCILLVFGRLSFAFFVVVFSVDCRFQYGYPHPDSLSFLNFLRLLASGPHGPNLKLHHRLKNTLKTPQIVHRGRSETIWSKWLSHCQVFWPAKEVHERISSLLNKLAQWIVWFVVLMIAERAVKANHRVVNQRPLIVLNGTETAKAFSFELLQLLFKCCLLCNEKELQKNGNSVSTNTKTILMKAPLQANGLMAKVKF